MQDLVIEVDDEIIEAHERQAAAKGMSLDDHLRDLFQRIADEVTDHELAHQIVDFDV